MSSPTQPLSLVGLARAWTHALHTTAETPIPCQTIEGCLRDQLDRLVDVLRNEPLRPEAAAEVVVAKLVSRGFAGEQSLGRTVEILGQGLPELPELSTVEGLAGKVASVLGALVSEYIKALRAGSLDESAGCFREAFESAPVGMLISQLDGTVTSTNPALTEILQHPPGNVVSRNISELLHPDDAPPVVAAYQALVEGRRGRFQRRVRALAGHGDTTWVALTVSVVRDLQGNPTHHVTMVEDVADRQLLEQRVRYQSLHDLLTGLPNRLHFAISLEALLERQPDATVMLCMIDLDCFGIVTDGLGISVGDLLLRSIAARLRTLVARERATVARLDADEFAIFIEECPTTPNAATLAARISAELSEPVYLAGRGLAVSACVGIVRRTAGESDVRELIRAAEATLHRAKRTGRGQWGLYDPLADAEERARYALATEMPAAWENGDVTLCYQPLVRLNPAATDAGRTVALATLLHWEHPERGLVTYEDCVALAEQTGLVLSIGPWMLRQACEQLHSWRDQLGTAVPPVRVDLTTHLTQDPDLVAVVRDALQTARLDTADIQLGIPVEVIVAGHGEAVDNVGTLADIGVRTVLTRYGQAVGNLVLLESLPVHGVELAGSLVRTAAQQPDSVLRPALSSMVPLISRTATTVIVAGIDDTEQADWWRQLGADSARGAAFAPAVPAKDIPKLLR
ncbi:MAG: putative bifunctional diguanylate cyclase/phosphodiesterase [Pseudonocardiaceae bacterium]